MKPSFGNVVRAALAGALVLAGTGAALARPDVRKMTCEQAQNLIRQNGAVVVTTGQYTYERIVATEWGCATPYGGEAMWVRTRDNKQCMIGYQCVRNDPIFPDFDVFGGR